jgi:hypothetical protein
MRESILDVSNFGSNRRKIKKKSEVSIMDLSKLPVIDAHCHPFTVEHQQVTEQQLRDIIMFKLEGGAPDHAVDTMTAHQFLREISDLFGCPATFQDVLATRNQQASSDYPAYVDRILGAAGITSLLPDTGYPYWKEVTIQDCAQVVTRRSLYEVFRVESAFRSRNSIYMADTTLDFDEYLEHYRAACTDAVKIRDCVALKTVMAYRTGLAIQPVSYSEAKVAYSNNHDVDIRAQKRVRDFLFKETAQLAIELDVPLVIHTGFTALTKPWSYGNPTDLVPAITDPALKDTVFVLLHGGYPWLSGAGFIAAHHPNVYIDLSEFNPASSIGIERHFEEILEFAPLSKLTFGSDGLGIPELFWYATVLAKRAMGNIFERFVKERLLRPTQAEDYAALFFHGTANQVYHLPE